MAFTKREIDAVPASREGRTSPRHSATFRYCPRCDTMVDDAATTCHACGVDLPKEENSQPDLRDAELAPIERTRIYEEEKARLQVRQQLEAKQKAQGCLVFLVIVFGFWLYAQIPHRTATPTKAPLTQEQLAQQKIDQAKREAKSKAEHEAFECKDSIQAYFNSQDFVKRQLKTPATAEFPWYWNIHVHDLGQCRHEVNAYVDHQNLFGAKIRTRYIATLRYAGDDKWTLEDLRLINP